VRTAEQLNYDDYGLVKQDEITLFLKQESYNSSNQHSSRSQDSDGLNQMY